MGGQPEEHVEGASWSWLDVGGLHFNGPDLGAAPVEHVSDEEELGRPAQLGKVGEVQGPDRESQARDCVVHECAVNDH